MSTKGWRWGLNGFQFPRLLAEIRAVGLTKGQYKSLMSSMGLAKEEIDSLLERAENSWEDLKKDIY